MAYRARPTLPVVRQHCCHLRGSGPGQGQLDAGPHHRVGPVFCGGAVVEVAQGAVPCPSCIIVRVGLEGPHCCVGGCGHPTAGGGSTRNRPSWLQTCGWDFRARAAVRWRDGVTVPWQPLRQRAATKDTTRREVSARGGDVNPHLGRGSLLVWCVPWWAGHLAMCKVGPAGRWSTPPRRLRVLRGAVVEVAQGRCYGPRA